MNIFQQRELKLNVKSQERSEQQGLASAASAVTKSWRKFHKKTKENDPVGWRKEQAVLYECCQTGHRAGAAPRQLHQDVAAWRAKRSVLRAAAVWGIVTKWVKPFTQDFLWTHPDFFRCLMGNYTRVPRDSLQLYHMGLAIGKWNLKKEHTSGERRFF